MHTITPEPTKLTDIARYVEAQHKAREAQSVLRDAERQLTTMQESILSGNALPAEVSAVATMGELDEATCTVRLMRSVHEKAQADLQRERGIASIAICEARRPQYNAIMRGCAHALIELGKAFQAQRDFHNLLDSQDVSFSASLPAQPFMHLEPFDSCGPIAYWLREAVERGFIDNKQIPAEWRQRWSM